MKKILLPTDFSKNSWNSICYALELFKKTECLFYLVHTYTPILYNPELSLTSRQDLELMDITRKNSQNSLKKTKENILEKYPNNKHQFETISSFNTLQSEIEKLRKAHAIDLIVMGTKGASGIKKLLFGTNTIHAIDKTKCPILAIPQKHPFSPIVKILFPTNYEVKFQKETLKELLEIGTNNHSMIHVLNATYGYDSSTQQKENKLQLEKLFHNIAHLYHYVNNQNIEETIENFKKDTSIDLIVMLRYKRTFFEKLFSNSLIHQIGFHLQKPLLVLPVLRKNGKID
jgi:nucleotide-binding universal stress UspA family protein